MKKVYMEAKVDAAKCVGDKICENVCPSGAITMVDRKAVVDGDKCMACSRCVDVCNEGAIDLIPLPAVRVHGVNPAEVDQERIQEICQKANMNPDEPICLCTFTSAREVAAAIIKGASTPEEVTRMTGARSACAMWCMAPMLRLLSASGADLTPPPRYKWYKAEAGIWDVSEKLADKHPQYRLGEDRRNFDESDLMDNMVYKFK